MSEKKPEEYRLATRLVRGGTKRSANMETAEAIFMTSGFTYDTAEQADKRFAGDLPGFVYGRYGNPTNRMFEERLMLLEGAGAEECLAVGSGMAAVNAAVLANVKAGDRVIGAKAMFASCLWILDTFAAAFRRGGDPCRWRRSRSMARRGDKTGIALALIETPAKPNARRRRYQSGRRHCTCRRRHSRCR